MIEWGAHHNRYLLFAPRRKLIAFDLISNFLEIRAFRSPSTLRLGELKAKLLGCARELQNDEVVKDIYYFFASGGTVAWSGAEESKNGGPPKSSASFRVAVKKFQTRVWGSYRLRSLLLIAQALKS